MFKGRDKEKSVRDQFLESEAATQAASEPAPAAEVKEPLSAPLARINVHNLDFTLDRVDRDRFFKFDSDGVTFLGIYVRPVDSRKSDEDADMSKYPNYLFKQLPDGNEILLPFNWSIGEYIAEKEREQADFFSRHAVEITRIGKKVTKPATATQPEQSVVQFQFRSAPLP